MKLVLGLFGLENFYGGDIKSYIEIAQMGEELGFDSVHSRMRCLSTTLDSLVTSLLSSVAHRLKA